MLNKIVFLAVVALFSFGCEQDIETKNGEVPQRWASYVKPFKKFQGIYKGKIEGETIYFKVSINGRKPNVTPMMKDASGRLSADETCIKLGTLSRIKALSSYPEQIPRETSNGVKYSISRQKKGKYVALIHPYASGSCRIKGTVGSAIYFQFERDTHNKMLVRTVESKSERTCHTRNAGGGETESVCSGGQSYFKSWNFKSI